jgi:NCS1 family nucleobase:cation symporter-1
MGVVVGGSAVVEIVAVVAGWIGSHDHLGFTVMSRASWGMRGGYWPVLNRIMTACIWVGIRNYWGGQCVRIVLGVVIRPKFAFMKNSFLTSTKVDTVSLISSFIFLIVFVLFYLLSPEKLQLALKIAFVVVVCNIFGLLIWAMRTMHGPGGLVHQPTKVSGSTLSRNALYGIHTILGLWERGILEQLGILPTLLYQDYLPDDHKLDSLRQTPECLTLCPGYHSSA